MCAWLGQTRVMRGWKSRQQVAAASWQRARQCRCKRALLEVSFKGWQWRCRAVKSRRAIVAGLSQERALQRQGAFLFALVGLTQRRRLCKHRLRHLCERKQACKLSALFAAWASLAVARKQVRILCCPRAASVAVHGSRVLTWLLLFCNKRERPSACWEKACNVLHIYETGRTGGGDSGEQVDTGSLLQFMAQFSAAFSPPTPSARAIWFLTQGPAARYLSMIKLVNSPCVIKCKVHANYDSVQSVSVLVRARGVGWCQSGGTK